MRMFFGGQITPALYADYLASLAPLYQALEDALLSHGEHPLVQAIVEAIVFRSKAIESDLSFFKSRGVVGRHNPVSLEMHSRINTLSESMPIGLIAHAYTRYVGDLSGGQILRRFVSEGLKLSGKEGLSFYDYDVVDVDGLKHSYRERFQRLVLTPAQIEKVTEEACLAFELNHRMFDAVLDAAVKG